jgi:hypothetical protein
MFLKNPLLSSTLAVASIFFSTQAFSATEGEKITCGMGVPPGSAGYAAELEERASQIRRNGFLLVCAANLRRYEVTYRRADLSPKSLDFLPVPIRGTEFEKFENLGANIENVNDIRSRLHRGFKTPEGRRVSLFEWDMSADGSNASDDPNANERVNGSPAQLIIMETPTREATSLLYWVEKRRSFELTIDSNVIRTGKKDWFLSLAASLPKSTPACPNEIPPKPVRIDSNGMPIFEPMPPILTPEQMDELAKPRRCK